jgi:hypothetical protein
MIFPRENLVTGYWLLVVAQRIYPPFLWWRSRMAGMLDAGYWLLDTGCFFAFC